VDEALVRGPDQLLPALVHMLAEGGGRLADLAVDGELQQVLQLVLVQALPDEIELDGGLLHALREVTLVEGEAKLPVLEHVVRPGLVIASASGLVLHCAASLRMRRVVASHALGMNVPLHMKGCSRPRRGREAAIGTRSPRGGR
jgi:hypothetical protein